MAPKNQKKWLTEPKGKLAKADIVAMLRKDEAWSILSQEKREEIYAFFPAPGHDEEPWDVTVNPMNTRLAPILESNILRFQKDLQDGKETKTWRENALKASKSRRDEGWDAMRKKHRKEERAKREAADAANLKNGNDEGDDAKAETKEGVADDQENHDA